MDVLLYENAMQVVPLLLIALFLDSRDPQDSEQAGLTGRSRQWARLQDRVFVLLGIVVFVLSLVVVAGALTSNRLTDAVVVSTLGLAIGLLFARIWRRLDRDAS